MKRLRLAKLDLQVVKTHSDMLNDSQPKIDEGINAIDAIIARFNN